MKSEHQESVERFMQLAGQEIPLKPCIPSKKVRLLRAKLTFEEAVMEKILDGFAVDIVIDGRTVLSSGSVIEFVISSERPANLVKILDGCCDTAVVNTGDLSACGISDLEPQRIIDDSNLRKFEMPACCSVTIHLGHGDYQCRECGKVMNGPYRRDDGKWMKSISWKVPDLGAEIERQSV